jgi:hypothetical protein
MLGGLGAIVATTYLIVSTYSPLPHWDEWTLFDHLALGKPSDLAWLWAQHNEHRIFLPKLFFLVDVKLFHGTQVFLLASLWLLQLLQVVLLSASLRVLGGLRGSAWRTGAGLIAFCIFCPTQYENLVWGFQLGFVIPATMATLAAFSLLLLQRDCSAADPRRRWLLWVCVAAASAATWSLANGMLLWPLLLFAAWWLGMRRSISVTLLLVAVANIGLYLFHYHRPTPESGVVPPLPAVGGVLRYVAVYFGSTWVRHSSGWVALIAGSAGLLAGFLVIVRALRQRRAASLLQLELALLMLVCVATAVITSSGRLHLGLQQASASRYQTFALIFWCSLGLSLLYAARQRPNSAEFTALASLLVLMMAGFGTQFRMPLIDAQWHQLRLKFVSLALITGVQDPAVLSDAFPDPQVVLRDAEYMKRNRLAIFAGEQYSQLGKPLKATYHVAADEECSGSVSSVQVMPAVSGQGYRITGFAWDTVLQRPARDLVATVDGRIAGFGSNVAIPLTLVKAGRDADPARFGFVIFVGNARAADGIDLYAVAGRSPAEVCRFAHVRP